MLDQHQLPKKLLPMFIKALHTAAKPVKMQLCSIFIKMLKLPNFEVRTEIQDLMLKFMVQSPSAFERQLFLELAAKAVDEFSREFFSENLGYLLLMYGKERTQAVAICFAKHAVKYCEGAVSIPECDITTRKVVEMM